MCDLNTSVNGQENEVVALVVMRSASGTFAVWAVVCCDQNAFVVSWGTLTGNPWPRPEFKKLYPRYIFFSSRGLISLTTAVVLSEA